MHIFHQRSLPSSHGWVRKDGKKMELWLPFLSLSLYIIILHVNGLLIRANNSNKKEYDGVPVSLVCLRVFAFFLCLKKVLVQMKSVACFSCQHPHLLSCRPKNYISLLLTLSLAECAAHRGTTRILCSWCLMSAMWGRVERNSGHVYYAGSNLSSCSVAFYSLPSTSIPSTFTIKLPVLPRVGTPKCFV